MADVYDVARYILEKKGQLSHMKLQKLVYYSQAWALVWNDTPLFKEPIEAWANGPVVPPLFKTLQGQFTVLPGGLGPADGGKKLTDAERDTIERILTFYGDKDAQWLSDATHMEAPWLQARAGKSAGERGNSVISHESMAEYYGSL